MKKITGIFLADPDERRALGGGSFSTGLVLEAEDGTKYLHNTTDVIVPFERIKPASEKVTRIMDWLRGKTTERS